MDPRVHPVENRQQVMVSMYKVVLHINLSQRKQKTQRTVLLDCEKGNPMVLRRLPNTITREDNLGKGLHAGVEGEIQGPVEHLDQEGELLDASAMPAMRVARGIGRLKRHAAAVSPLGRVFGRCQGGEGQCRRLIAVFRQVSLITRLYCGLVQQPLALTEGLDGIAWETIEVA